MDNHSEGEVKIENQNEKDFNNASPISAILVTTKEASSILGITPRSVTRYVKKGVLSAQIFTNNKGANEYRLDKSKIEKLKRHRDGLVRLKESSKDGISKETSETGKDNVFDVPVQSPTNSVEYLREKIDDLARQLKETGADSLERHPVIVLLKEQLKELKESGKVNETKWADKADKLERQVEDKDKEAREASNKLSYLQGAFETQKILVENQKQQIHYLAEKTKDKETDKADSKRTSLFKRLFGKKVK